MERWCWSGGGALRCCACAYAGAWDGGALVGGLIEKVMEALVNPNIHLIGIYGWVEDPLLQQVRRRIERDKIFDKVISATVARKSNVKKIQDDLADQLGFSFSQKFKDEKADKLRHKVGKILEHFQFQQGFTLTLSRESKEKRANELILRANELIRRIKNEQRILIILRDLDKRLDLNKIGIPYGANHKGCKILLTSTAEYVLSNYMHTHKNFKVG